MSLSDKDKRKKLKSVYIINPEEMTREQLEEWHDKIGDINE